MTTFYTWGFPALNAPTPRTLPERLSDVVNVLDWGAGAGGDVTAQVQAAIDYCISKGGGKVYFPPGGYFVSNLAVGSNSVNVGVQIVGGGGFGSLIVSNNAGWTISGGGRTYDCLEGVADCSVENRLVTSPNGVIRATRSNFFMRGVFIGQGWFGVDVSQCDGATLTAVTGTGPGNGEFEIPRIDASDAVSHGFVKAGCLGLALGNHGIAEACRFVAYDIAYALSGAGAAIAASASEVSNIGARVGWGWRQDLGNFGEVAANGCSIIGFQSERNDVVWDLYNCTGGFFASFVSGQGDGTPGKASISNMSWSAGGGGVVTVTSTNPHNMIASPYCLQIIPTNLNWIDNYAGGLIKCTSAETTKFTFPLATDPGAYTGTISAMHWNLSDFAGTIVGTALTTSGASGDPISVGQFVTGAGVAANTQIVSGSGSNWVVNNSQNVGPEAMQGSTRVVTVTISSTTVALPAGTHVAMSGPDASWGGPTVFVTGGDTTHFTYNGPSSAPSGTQTGTWTITDDGWKYPMSYGVRCRKVYDTEIGSLSIGPSLGKAGIDLDYEGSAAVDFRNDVFRGTDTSYGWIPPHVSSQLAGWQFSNCSGQVMTQSIYNNLNYLNGKMVFADLPTGAGTQPRLIGAQYDISDGAAGVNIGSAVTSGGVPGNNYQVRWNGSNWIRIG